MKVFQIVNGKCHWHTPYENVGETLNRYPKSCVFVEAPDYVFEGWGYRTKDDEGNAVTGDDRFVQPIPPEGYIYDEDTGRFVPEDEVANILHKACFSPSPLYRWKVLRCNNGRPDRNPAEYVSVPASGWSGYRESYS